MADDALHVAIIGGGLCGITLAIALEKRNVPYIIYEARESFTEIGAGLNLGPNALHALRVIDPALGDKMLSLATRNPPGKEETWMAVRLGAPTDAFEDAHLVTELQSPPTGNMTLSRNELLQLLAGSMRKDRARFNKKLTGIVQSSTGVRMTFADGTEEEASAVIGCDGAHSHVRSMLLGADHPAALPKFSNTGGYRAVFPIDLHERVVGGEKARMSHVYVGPTGYVITYPIEGASKVNIGVWVWKDGEWNDRSWVLSNQKPQMLEDLKDWGATVHRIMDSMSDDTQFWATFYHGVQPEHYFNGRLCVIGDAAHSMPPHQGQGAAQSVEDACVIGAVLQQANNLSDKTPHQPLLEAAFQGFEVARKDRFETVARSSAEAHGFWKDSWRKDLTQDDLVKFDKAAHERMQWIWNEDIEGQQRKAVDAMLSSLRPSLPSGTVG